ncbi:unnamed protein product, partial [Oppiella nova]
MSQHLVLAPGMCHHINITEPSHVIETKGLVNKPLIGSVGSDNSKNKSVRRVSSLRLANGRVSYTSVKANEDESKSTPTKKRDDIRDIKINICQQKSLDLTQTDPLVKGESEQNLDSESEYVNDYITPEMNYKDGTACKSPPVVTIKDMTGVTWSGEKDDISLYGTPKEEMLPGLAEAKGESLQNLDSESEYVNDYITPEMNYKDGTACKSPPVVTIKDMTGVTWSGEKDDISLYGTPKEEMLPGLAEAKGESLQNLDSESEYVNDYITPEMNYKDGTACKSPPVVTIKDMTGVTWSGEKDDISLYGTPKEEMLPGLAEAKVPSFMRSQIEALFQPS